MWDREYKMKWLGDNIDRNRIIYFSDPELISWLYKNDVDITMPLRMLKIDYAEMDEMNSTLFEYAMNVNAILAENSHKGFDAIEEMMPSMDKISKLQKELIKKI